MAQVEMNNEQARSVPSEGTKGDVYPDVFGVEHATQINLSSKAVNLDKARLGDTLAYTIMVKNDGGMDLNNVLVTDTLPNEVIFITNTLSATSGRYGYHSGVITWTGTVSASNVVSITFGADIASAGTISNAAVIQSGGMIITRTAQTIVPPPVYLPVLMGGGGIAVPEPDIAVSPLSVDYGDVIQGTFSDKTVTITNTGTADLTVTGLMTSGGEFTVVSPAVPFTITVGEGAVGVPVRFSPTALGSQTGTLDITSNDPDESLVTVALTGTGIGQFSNLLSDPGFENGGLSWQKAN